MTEAQAKALRWLEARGGKGTYAGARVTAGQEVYKAPLSVWTALQSIGKVRVGFGKVEVIA